MGIADHILPLGDLRDVHMDHFLVLKTVFKPPPKIVLRPSFKNLLQNRLEEWFEFFFQEPSSRQS